MNNDQSPGGQSPQGTNKSMSKLRQQFSTNSQPGGLKLTNIASQLSAGSGTNVEGGIGGENYKGTAWFEVERMNGMVEDTITDLDKKLNRVLAKQEYEYLKGYNIYVKQKEKDLRDLIAKLNEKNSNNTLKDEKITKLERTIGAIQLDQIDQASEKKKLLESVKYWTIKA